MKQLVIFDLDGTLLNTIADLAGAANYALQTLGYPIHAQEAYLRFVGNGISKLLERALPPQARTSEVVAQARAVFMPYYEKHGAEQTQPYTGIPDLLAELFRCGIKLAVASNKYQPAAQSLVKHYFPQIPFIAVAGQREGLPVKPNPLFVQEILTAAQLAAEAVLYVGDSEVDMQTAVNAGVSACAVTWGFCTREKLAAYQPAFIADTPADILSALKF